MPRRPRRSESKKPSPAIEVSKKPASILDTATIIQAAAKPVARSDRETGRAFQYSAALLLCGRNINCLVQVNISKEDSKHGLDKENVIDFIKNTATNYKNIKIKGLMTMAPFTEDREQIRNVFRQLKELSLEIKNLNIEGVSTDELSMGMSNDYDIAIEEGSTIVRVGTSIFGKRNYN